MAQGVPELDGEPAPDVLLLNDDDLTYARTSMDERSLRTALERVADFEDTMPRALSVSTAWDLMRACERRPGRGRPRDTGVRRARK